MPEEQVFISYSHEDKKWCDDLNKHLKPYLRNGSITSWSDEQIVPGSKWLEEIKSALAQTKVAVLLVSSDFLASDFIHEHELGPLLKEPPQGGVKILWVPVSASSYEKTPLKDYQALLDPEHPLDGMADADREKAWVKICKRIEKAVEPSRELAPGGQQPYPQRQHPHRRNILFVISGILVVVIMIVASVNVVPVLRNMQNPKVPVVNVNVANEVMIGDKIFLRSGQGSYVIAAMLISHIYWPHLGNKDKAAKLTLLGDGPLRDGSVVQVQSLEQILQDNNVLESFENNPIESNSNVTCYYAKQEPDNKKQDWIIQKRKRNTSDPVLHYGDEIYLENAYYRNKLLTKNKHNAEFLTLDEGVEWWWVLEKVF